MREPHALPVRADEVRPVPSPGTSLGRSAASTRARIAAIAMLVVCAAGGWPHAATAADGYEERADQLWRVMQRTTWPASAFTATSGRFQFTILGEDEMAVALVTRFGNKSLQGRPIFVRFVNRVADVKDANAVFIASSDHVHIAEVIETLGSLPALTIADAQGFLASGGAVQLGDAECEINQPQVARLGLRLAIDRAGTKVAAK